VNVTEQVHYGIEDAAQALVNMFHGDAGNGKQIVKFQAPLHGSRRSVTSPAPTTVNITTSSGASSSGNDGSLPIVVITSPTGNSVHTGGPSMLSP
jgi:hypothetical protein